MEKQEIIKKLKYILDLAEEEAIRVSEYSKFKEIKKELLDYIKKEEK